MDQKVGGISLYDEGPREGLPVVFIHGFPFNRRMWEPQTKFFSKNYHVISYDLRGHGQSEIGDGQYTVELFVDDLIALMDHLKIQKTIICGLSLGGYIALRAVERQAERFSGLVLCDTKSEADTNEAKIKRASALRAVKKDGVEKFADEFVKSVLCEKTLQSKPEVVQSVLGMMRGNSTLGIGGTLLALAARTDTTGALAKMNLPALILVGEKDKLTPPSASDAMLKLLPKATLHVIPGAGHLSNLENPDFFNARLTDFLNSFKK